MYEYEKDGIVTEVYGRFALALGFNMDGRILIRPESLCLKLKTQWNVGLIGQQNAGLFNANSTPPPPNLAQILRIGDKITFDAQTFNGGGKSIPWIGAAGSVKVTEVCTKSNTYPGHGTVIELSPDKGVLSFADKKVFFEKCASFPKQFQDLTAEYRMGDLVSFIAVEQREVNGPCQWKAISVEKFNTTPADRMERAAMLPAAIQRIQPLTRPIQSVRPIQPYMQCGPPPQSVFQPAQYHQPIFEQPSPPMFPQHRQPLFPQQANVFAPIHSPPPFSISPPALRQQTPSPPNRRPRSRDRSPLNVPKEFDTMPKFLKGHARVAYCGKSCGMLKDLATNHKIFFYNHLVTYPSKCRDLTSRGFDVGRLVYFEATKTNRRLNLQAYHDATRIEVLDKIEEARVNAKLKDAGTDIAQSAAKNAPVDCGFGKLPEISAGDLNSVNNPFMNWIPAGAVTSLKSNESRKKKTSFDAYKLRNNNGHKIDTDAHDLEESEAVKFDKKTTDFGKLKDDDDEEEANLKVTVAGDTRRCVLKESPPEELDEIDKLMDEQEKLVEMYDFEDGDM